jgi:hypothetical protein
MPEAGGIAWIDGSRWVRVAPVTVGAGDAYVRLCDIEAQLGAALNTVLGQSVVDPIAALAQVLDDARRHVTYLPGDKDPNAENRSLRALGLLRHAPPPFSFFDPVQREALPVVIKEVKLPRAAQTHEVVYEPVTNCIFLSQMSNSVLVRIPVGNEGLLVDDQDAWQVGEVDAPSGNGISGMHNLSLSPSHPGCVWVSLQFANQLLLVDAATLHVLKVLQVPPARSELAIS